MIAEPTPPPVPVVSLADRIKTWPMLAAHRMEHIEAVLLDFEERLTKLEPKKGVPSHALSETYAGNSIFAPKSPIPAGVHGSSPPSIFAPPTANAV